MQAFVDENLGDDFVPFLASSDLKIVSGRARTWRKVVGSSPDSHCTRVLGIEITSERTAQRFGDLIT